MNVINEPQVNHWMKSLVGTTPILRGHTTLQADILRWLTKRYRKWLYKNSTLIDIGEVVTDATVIPLVENHRRPPIPIEEVFVHRTTRSYFDWKYEINLAYFREVNQSVVRGSVPVVMSEYWQWRMLAEGNFQIWLRSERLTQELQHILDWMRADPRQLPKDITRLSVEDAVRHSNTWHELAYVAMQDQRAKELNIDMTNPGERHLVELDVTEAHVEELRDEQSLLYEAAKMHNCVNGYWPRVVEGDCRLFHLIVTTKTGKEQATLELLPKYGETGWTIGQLRSYCNGHVSNDMKALAVLVETKFSN